MALLQVALDFIDLDKAVEVAGKVYPYADIIEAGTPLIKSEGIRAVNVLKGNFPGKRIFADLKIMDAGVLEARMAFGAGADMISVCAQASAETIREAIEETRRWDREVMIDLIGSTAWISRAGELSDLYPDYFCIHTFLDEQAKGRRPFERLEEFIREIKLPFSIAGGIRPDDIALIMPFRPAIIVVGGYITRAASPEAAARTIKMAIEAHS